MATIHDSVEIISENHLRGHDPSHANPQSPKFLVYQKDCQKLFGPKPQLILALEDADSLFHEAAVFIPGADEDALFVTSNAISALKGLNAIRISRLARQARDDTKWRMEHVPDGDAVMSNGGVNFPETKSVLFCSQGDSTHPSSLVTLGTEPPYSTRILLNTYHGRHFNSVNDVVVAQDGCIWFTDPVYGFEQGFRPEPELPSQVYRFDPSRMDIRVVADGFGHPNGLCFSPDERTMYITDTDQYNGDGSIHKTRASHIYAFDVTMIHGAPFLTNRRFFAMADKGIPDGIKCDLEGNVYSGCGDGIGIWAADGSLLGKIIVPGGVANFCFGRPGELLLLNEKKFWVAKVGEHVQGALLQQMGVTFP